MTVYAGTSTTPVIAWNNTLQNGVSYAFAVNVDPTNNKVRLWWTEGNATDAINTGDLRNTKTWTEDDWAGTGYVGVGQIGNDATGEGGTLTGDISVSFWANTTVP